MTCHLDDDLEDEDDDQSVEPDCLICCGDGYVEGRDLGDPLWYDEDRLYPCPSCHGSGLAKDMTYC